MKKRLRQVLAYVLAAVAAGWLYSSFVEHTGIGVPCMFRLVTGWKCPGCGVTQMCIAWMHMDVRKAFSSNQMLFLLSPVLCIIFLKYTVSYVRTGRWQMGRWSSGILCGSAALLLLFAVFRNLAGI